MVTAGYLLFPTGKQKEGAGDCIAEGNRGWKEEIGKYHFSKIYITKIMPISTISIMAWLSVTKGNQRALGASSFMLWLKFALISWTCWI